MSATITTKASRTTTSGSGLDASVPTAILTALVCSLTASVITFAVVDAGSTRGAGSSHTAVDRVSLPEQCKQFYNDGTDRWVECMGVGRK
jgi:hypothetical protein